MLRIRPAMRVYCFVIAVLSCVAGLPQNGFSDESEKVVFEFSELTIIHDENKYLFQVEIANTTNTRRRGLMERRHLDEDAGMLFDYGKPKQVHMWMKNTFIPLDMVFIDSSGKVVGVKANTTPHSTEVIPSPGPVLAVLELKAGTTSRLSIGIGDRIIHEIFKP